MLFPQQNQYRSIHDLSGFWRFQPDPSDTGERNGWPVTGLSHDAMVIAVPGAWNEQLTERGLKNFVGACWYETEFISPRIDLSTERVILRVGAADHAARVWLNGSAVGSHRGGFLPFELDLTGALAPIGHTNRILILVDSRLTMETLPQGIDRDVSPYNDVTYDRRHVFPQSRFDFFPYGGLTRPVQLLVVPANRIESISVHATLNGTIDISVRVGGQPDDATVEILDADGVRVAGPIPVDLTQGSAQCTVDVRDPELWAPATPYLYAASVRLRDASGKECDRYVEHFGFREITIEKGTLLLNGKPLYLAGFGKHEDFPVVGRGQFRPGYIRDFELLRWIGANSFRTSHYPYDDEILHLADRLGFLVIDEAPAVSLGFPSDRFEALAPLLETHRRVLTELVERDRNHPCVIAWSPMNEPNLWSEPQYQNDASRRYFREVNDHVHALDPSRPTIAITMAVFTVDDVALESCDIIGINRYYGWYTEPGELGRARTLLENEMDALYARYDKPIMITECGVDTVEGYHASTAQMFTEEYQIEYLRTYASVADQRPFCAGFHAWNFADFLTPQHFRRVVLNRKGVFTRDRDPKGAAFFLREHWRTLERLDPAHRPRQYCDKFLVSDLRSPCS